METLCMPLSKLRNRIRKATPFSLLTYLLFCVFGVGSWVALNGIWAEISVLVTTLPECFDLPAILAVTVQVANIGPLFYIVTKYCLQRFSVKVIIIEIVAVFILVGVGLVTCVLLSFLWDMTAVVAGEVHSVALIALTFGLSLVDCTSTLIFIPFMKHFPAQYISALYIGEGMSGVLPSVIALSQGFVNDSLVCVGDYTGVGALGINFSPNIYFVFLSSLTLLCGLAFVGIVSQPTVRKQLCPSAITLSTRSPWRASVASSCKDSSYVEERLPSPLETSDEEIVEQYKRECTRSNDHHESKSDDGQTTPLISSNSTASSMHGAQRCRKYLRRSCNNNSYSWKVPVVAWNVCSLLVCMMLVNFITNGAIPAISAFIFKPYGNTVYHIAVNLGILAQPLAVIIYMLVPCKSKELVIVLTAVSSLLGIYMFIVATLSPDPPLKDRIVGDLSIVCVYTALSGIVGYIKMAIFVILHGDSTDRDSALILMGVAIQLGAFLGAVLFFFLVYFTSIFKS